MEEGQEKHLRKILGDVSVPVRVGMGRSKMAVHEIAKLKEGAIISMDLTIGEPMDVTIAGKLMAKGEVVIVNDRYGIRLSEVL